MEWPAGLTEDDKRWLRENLELATSPLEEENEELQEAHLHRMQQEVPAHWPTWDGVPELPKWLREGLGAEGQAHHSTATTDPRAFVWAYTPPGEPELRGVHDMRPGVRVGKVVRQPSKQREVYAYRNWAGTARRDVVR